MALVMIFITLCETLLETATEVLISVRDIDLLHYATMNGVTVIFGTALATALVMTSGFIASGFDEPQLARVVQATAILPLLSGLGCVPNAASRREMKFKPLALRMIVGVTCGGLTGILLTLLGAGVWALVCQALVQRLVCMLVLWGNSPHSFHITLSRSHCRDLSAITGPLLTARIMGWVSSQVPRFLLALNLTVAELGLFSLAARLSDIVVQVTLVPRAAVARLELRRYATDAAGLDAAAKLFVSKMSALCFPVCFGGAVLVPTLIHTWLNPKWSGAVLPAQLLLLSTCAWVSFYGGGMLFLALNQQRSEALMSVLQTATTVLAALSFGAYGLTAVTVALAIRPFLLVPVEIFVVRRRCRVSIEAFLKGQRVALCAALGSALLVLVLRDRAEAALGTGVALVMLSAAGLALYALLLGVQRPGTVLRLLLRRPMQI